MRRKRGELVPIGEAFDGSETGRWQALREASPQARYHFTQADQVNQLVGASEADPDLGFMARLLALLLVCPAPIPATGIQYKRVNGPFKLVHGGGRRITNYPTATCRAF